jgi:uncharacterized protein (TIGR00255 family)
LDLRFRLPPGFDRVESQARATIPRRFKRGNVSLSLTLNRPDRRGSFSVNRDALAQVLALADELRNEIGASPPSIDSLLNVRGVIEQVEEDASAEVRARLEDGILASLETALDGLAAARLEEGARLAVTIGGHLDEIARLSAAAEATAATQPEALDRRLRERIADVVAAEPGLSEERLAQEVALLVAKADVREELDRLVVHIESARELTAAGGAVGRRLDFLCQEFNREANTLCSKSADTELTRTGIDLKAAIEQLREQVQNIE